MNIRYTHHATQRMAQRKIRAEQVIETLEAPDEIMPGDQDELIAVRRYGTREIRVVYEEVDGNNVVIYTVIKSRIQHRS